MLSALIVDDEAPAISYLQGLIERRVPQISVLHTAVGAKAGLEAIATHQPDLLFLDIEMPHMTGFELLSWDFGIIYTTAFDEYAIKAIKFSALDYLLKPIDLEELKTAVARFIAQKSVILKQNSMYKNLLRNLAAKDESEFRLALPTRTGVYLFDLHEIVRVESDANYSQFYFEKKPKILVARTLKEYAELLADHGFIRIHKSHLVNKSHVASYLAEGKVLMRSGHEIEVSRRRRQEVRRVINN